MSNQLQAKFSPQIMDCEKLISLVYERRSLWDPDDVSYHNREKARHQWYQIATILETTSANVKSKWQNLRDTYRRELMKKNSPSGTKWRYFQQMNFLRDTYSTKLPVGNGANVQKSEPNDLMVDFSDVHVELYNEETSLEDDSFSEQADDERYQSVTPDESITAEKLSQWANKRPPNKTVPISDLIELEKAKLVHLETMSAKKPKVEDFDEDYYFLMSLLPHLRAIPQHMKLITRVKLQQVLIENQAQFQKFPPSSRGSSNPATSSPNPSD